MNLFKGYLNFLRDNKLMAVAVGVILGLKLSALFTSLVNDIIMPGLFHWSFGSVKQWDHDGIMFSQFIGATLEFLVVAFVIFVVFKYIFGIKSHSSG